MKKFLNLCLLVIAISSYKHSGAQPVVNINVGSQPSWGPSGYNHVDYYYLPDMDAYYYVPQKQFIYQNGNNWVFVPNPPAQYKNVNLYRTYKVVINEPKPYLQHNVYQVKYKKYKGNYYKQKTLKANSGHAYGHYKNKSGANKNYTGKGKNGNGKAHGASKGKH